MDAIHADTLRELVRDSIEQHIDQRRLDVLREAEKSERELLLDIAGKMSS